MRKDLTGFEGKRLQIITLFWISREGVMNLENSMLFHFDSKVMILLALGLLDNSVLCAKMSVHYRPKEKQNTNNVT